jgi:hypothetical protein
MDRQLEQECLLEAENARRVDVRPVELNSLRTQSPRAVLKHHFPTPQAPDNNNARHARQENHFFFSRRQVTARKTNAICASYSLARAIQMLK